MKIGINALFLKFPASGSGQYLTHLLSALAEVDTENEYVLLEPYPRATTRVPSLSYPTPLSSVGISRRGPGAAAPGGVSGVSPDLLSLTAPQGSARNKPPSESPTPAPTGYSPTGMDHERFSYQLAAVPSLARRNENIEKLVWEQLTGPAAARKAGVDILHVPYFAPPLLPRTPTVVTIHDVIPLRLPLYRTGARLEAYMHLVARAARKATLIITVSQHARQDMIDALKLPPERVLVIYEAAGDEYRPITDPSVLAAVRARYGLGERYVLCLSGLDQRKNIPQLVRAFAQLYHQPGNPNLQLFISGNPDKQRGPLFPDPRPVASELGVTNQIVYRFVEEEDKPALYSAASVYVFPSLYEGFGLPPLEAMSCGAPVICSNRTSLPEVVGDAAISLDPNDTEALAEAMHSVLTNKTLEADLRARSQQRAAQFSWRKTASETIAAYQEAFARSKKM